ncbi:MAG: translational GTPase TypA [Firmicutes bacterium]|nr:translational GTPase TypA [Bacillota bacterium]
MKLRNIVIIAHVDHGKTTLVDGLLKQSKTFRDNEAAMSQDLIMDSFDQERERGITILAKNTAVYYKDVKINIIDTPGHVDFGGEVERTLNMADGALLLIDAQEGPMPQTKFVLKKAMEIGLKPIVVINKIDKRDADIADTLSKTHDLFLNLATKYSQLDFPVYYSISREGKAWDKFPNDAASPADLTPIFEAILKYIPAPKADSTKLLQMLVTNLDWDSFQGKYAIGRITNGVVKKGLPVSIIKNDGTQETGRIEKVYVFRGLKKLEVPEAQAGDIVAITGISSANIGDTISDLENPVALPSISIEEPTMKIAVSANTSPFAGKEGQFVTGRHLLERIKKELQTNVSLKMEENGTEFIVSGRGELHLSVFIETLRREGYELQVRKPQVIIKEIDGVLCEPIEELTVDVDTDKVGAVTSEIASRRGIMQSQSRNSDGSTRFVFEITTRGLLGLRSRLLTVSRGTTVINSIFLRFQPEGAMLPKNRNGVLIASDTGKAVTYGLNIAQGRGITFIPPQTEVYAGQIIGLSTRSKDIEINVTREKKQTNIRASNSDFAIILTPPTILSLEQCLDFLEDDEFLEVTPKSLRLRKTILDSNLRYKSQK